MKSTRSIFLTLALVLLFAGNQAFAASVSGTVTDKTTGKPAAGDTVVLVDVQAGMGEAAKTTTDAQGHYILKTPGSGPYLVRVTHQGAGYFIAAPQGAAPGDIPVYDVAPKVRGVSVEADVLEIETDGGQLRVNERFFVHNVSSPPLTQWTKRSFEIVLPPEAVIADAEARRPTGLPTSIQLDPDGPQGHYSYNFPIQPDDGEKDTLFQVSYSLPYTTGKYSFKAQESLPADNLAVLLPMAMTFTGGAGAAFQPVKQDPGIQTLIAKGVPAGKIVEFTISGTGSMPRENQGAATTPQPSGDNTGQPAGAQPGGGIGAPINTPDPLSKYKWWILGALALILAAGAAFLLRRPVGPPPGSASTDASATIPASFAPPPSTHNALLNALKEELFTLESEKINGTITADDYAQAKAALETVLKRALNRK